MGEGVLQLEEQESVSKTIYAFSGSFLPQIVCQGQQTDLYGHFIHTTKQEAFELVVMLDLAKDRFGIKAALFSLLYPSFGL